MAKNAKRIEIRNGDGQLLFTLRVYDEAAGTGSEAKDLGQSDRPVVQLQPQGPQRQRR